MNQVITINPEKSSLAEMVHQQIRNDIYDFHLLPGERYTEANLAERYKVSRTPLRLALHMLLREGFLNKGNGHAAWQIPPINLDYFQDLYELRVNLELIAIRKICTTETPPDFSALKNFWFVSEADRSTDGQAVANADEFFHSTLVKASGNSEMSRVYTDITERIRIIRRLDFIEGARITAAYEEHANLLRALIKRKQELAELLLKAHIEVSRSEIRNLTLHRLSEAANSNRQLV
jgi:DNA-binding GntR family transcriptional regulator